MDHTVPPRDSSIQSVPAAATPGRDSNDPKKTFAATEITGDPVSEILTVVVAPPEVAVIFAGVVAVVGVTTG